ncbi:unnamed protein product, partial [Staurois parvus]
MEDRDNIQPHGGQRQHTAPWRTETTYSPMEVRDNIQPHGGQRQHTAPWRAETTYRPMEGRDNIQPHGGQRQHTAPWRTETTYSPMEDRDNIQPHGGQRLLNVMSDLHGDGGQRRAHTADVIHSTMSDARISVQQLRLTVLYGMIQMTDLISSPLTGDSNPFSL